MNQAQKRLKLIHGLSNEIRLDVLEALKTGEKSVTDLLSILEGCCTQSNLSQHLACLKECGLITSCQSGKFVYYSLSNEPLLHLLDVIDETILSMEWSQAEDVECVSHVN
ncbi:metalloregulator ArsR/SmtB family transcription factor [Lactovum odontotermitis]